MPKFEFHLAVVDEEDLPAMYAEVGEPIELPVMTRPIHRRKKEGDVVNVTKHPSLGNGRKTISNYLIVVVDVKADVTLKGKSAFVCKNCDESTSMFLNGEWQSIPHFKEEYIVNRKKLICSSCGKDKFVGGQFELGLREYFKQAGLEGGINRFDIDKIIIPEVCKNRYSLKLATLKTLFTELDYAKVRGKEYIYQPFKTREDVLIGKPNLVNQIDCGFSSNDWVSVEWSDTNLIMWDNVLEKAVGPSDLGLKAEAK